MLVQKQEKLFVHTLPCTAFASDMSGSWTSTLARACKGSKKTSARKLMCSLSHHAAGTCSNYFPVHQQCKSALHETCDHHDHLSCFLLELGSSVHPGFPPLCCQVAHRARNQLPRLILRYLLLGSFTSPLPWRWRCKKVARHRSLPSGQPWSSRQEIDYKDLCHGTVSPG